jgi:Methyltransferase domain
VPVSEENAARLCNPPPWGYSLSNVRELLLGCLKAIQARSILEIGSYEGDLTVELLDWAEASGAEVATVEPAQPPKLLERSRAHPNLVLHEATSHEVLAGLDALPDAVIIDGDHNYFTLSEELRLIAELAGEDPLPLLMFHDVCWPHARRDTYYDVDRIPEDRRPPVGKDVGLVPGDSGVNPLGLPYPWAALREGGPRNGTLTAIEDFMEPRGGLRLAIVPAFFGFGVLCPDGIQGAERIAELLGPFDRHPVFERLERNRVEHLSAGHARGVKISALEQRIAQLEDRVRRHEHLLRQMLDSRAFTVAEYVSRAYQRGKPTFSRETVRRALES